MENLRVLLLGAGGLLGRECQEVLGDLGTIWSFTKEQLDITRSQDVKRTLLELLPHFIVNCAAYTDVDACEGEVERAFLVNARAPGNIAAEACRIGAKVVHISTDYVFDGQKPLPLGYGEKDPPSPRNIYGKSKLEGERLVLQAKGSNLVVRTGWLYGRHGKCFPRAILRKAIRGETLRVVCDQFGSPTWTRSLAFQIRVLMEAGVGGIVHATSMGYCSWYEFAREILELVGLKAEIQPCNSSECSRPAKRPRNSILEKGRLSELGLNRMNLWNEDLNIFLEKHSSEIISELKREA